MKHGNEKRRWDQKILVFFYFLSIKKKKNKKPRNRTVF